MATQVPFCGNRQDAEADSDLLSDSVVETLKTLVMMLRTVLPVNATCVENHWLLTKSHRLYEQGASDEVLVAYVGSWVFTIKGWQHGSFSNTANDRRVFERM